MVSNEQKGRILKTILQELGVNQKNDSAILTLQKLLMDDCHGKLYKYMPVKEYTIPSLENNIFHISSPDMFNDPFDCKIGVDIQSMVEAIFPKEKLESYWKDFIAINSGIITLENIPDERKSIISSWINNSKLADFIASNKKGKLSNDDMNDLVLSNFDNVCEMVFPFFERIACCDQKSVNLNMIQKLIDKMPDDTKKQLIKNNSKWFDFIKGLGGNDDIDEIGLAEKAYEFLDPENTDAIKEFKEIFDPFEQNLNELLCSKFKVGCLCADNKSILMWSHYADNHKGICVEYDFSEVEAGKLLPMPVYYTKIRPKVPWKEVVDQSSQMKGIALGSLMEALLTKDIAWKYEREWRILVPANEGVDNIPAPPIKCIYLGALASEEDVTNFKKLADKMGIPIKRMIVDRGKYELHTTAV